MNSMSVAIARKISDDNKKVFNRKRFEQLSYKDSFQNYYKKEKETVSEKKGSTIRCFIEELNSGISRMSVEEKTSYIDNIYRKYKSGKKLTYEELNYLKNNDPDTYLHAMRMKMKRAILEEKLKHCRTRREAELAYEEAQLNVDGSDPDREVLQATYYDVWYEFARSGMYSRLQTEEAKEMHIKMAQRAYVNCNYSAQAEYSEGKGEVIPLYESRA